MGCVSDSTTGLFMRGVSPTSSWGVGEEVNSVPEEVMWKLASWS